MRHGNILIYFKEIKTLEINRYILNLASKVVLYIDTNAIYIWKYLYKTQKIYIKYPYDNSI